MRVLFTTLPAYGSFQPLAALAQALIGAGHEVVFATSATFCAVIERAGFRCLPAGLDWVSDGRNPVYSEILRSYGPDGSPVRHVFAEFMAPRMVPDLLTIASKTPFDVVIRDPLEFGGCVAAEVLSLPHVACGPLFCFWDRARHAASGETPMLELDEVRAAFGLPPDPELAMLHRHLYLACLPPSFLGPGLTIPPTVRFLRPEPFDQWEGDIRLPWLAEFSHQPMVHASLGTIYHRTPGVFEDILTGLRDEPLNLVLAIGRDQDPSEFGPQPPNVRIDRYLPHAALLPRCAVAITHGGYGSVMACLRAGVPLVVLPLGGGDQPGNAQRCAALGVARIVPGTERSPVAIQMAVREVLDDPRFRQHAQTVREQILALPDIAEAVELVKRLVAGETQFGTPS